MRAETPGAKSPRAEVGPVAVVAVRAVLVVAADVEASTCPMVTLAVEITVWYGGCSVGCFEGRFPPNVSGLLPWAGAVTWLPY